MRLLLLFPLLLLSQLGFAQFSSFEAGYYVLVDNHSTRYPAEIKLRDENTLLVRGENTKKEKLDLQDVLFFQVANRRFVPVGGFFISKGLGGTEVARGFAQLLDSGQVKLYEYKYYLTNPPVGNTMSVGSSYWQTLYLLQRPNDEEPTPVEANRLSGAGKYFRQTLAPFISSRPDLQKLLADRKITLDNLVPFIRALNSGQPFTGSLPQPPTREPY
ncbi:hypothetical protein CDA63_16335 [Hymenobacter amundsenii]|uniref:DUF4369 domain-containing protein n=1 Tax=Hymenobacter amundsenii TaxID=2006685 RepID=A0A246FHI6_9BACT|nr:hypothetical protein [Hymenobacter amundsenii]OWP61997.1 hypothetical protein CDA63_16335 [Hymenobacter amundsenii]